MSQAKIKGKVPVIIFLIFSLFFSTFGNLLKIGTSNLMLIIQDGVNFTSIISLTLNLIFAILGVLAPAILLVYNLFLCKKFQPRIFMVATYTTVALSAILSVISNVVPFACGIILSFLSPAFLNSTRVWIPVNYIYSSFSMSNLISIIFYTIIALSFLFLAISYLFKMKNRVIPTIVIVINIVMFILVLLALVLSSMHLITPIKYGMGMGMKYLIYNLGSIISSFIITIGKISLYNALIIFILSNKIKKTLNLANEHDLQKLHSISPKSALKILNESLESGTISEEEYNQQREIILNKI